MPYIQAMYMKIRIMVLVELETVTVGSTRSRRYDKMFCHEQRGTSRLSEKPANPVRMYNPGIIFIIILFWNPLI